MQSSSCSYLKHSSEASVGRLIVESLSHPEHWRNKEHEKMSQMFCWLSGPQQLLCANSFDNTVHLWTLDTRKGLSGITMALSGQSLAARAHPTTPARNRAMGAPGQPQPQTLGASLGRLWGLTRDPRTWKGCGEPQEWAGTCRAGRASVPWQ